MKLMDEKKKLTLTLIDVEELFEISALMKNAKNTDEKCKKYQLKIILQILKFIMWNIYVN